MLELFRRIRAAATTYVLVALVVAALVAYILAQELIRKLYTGRGGVHLGESCPDPSAKAENPNTTLFVNCGGYLE